MEDYFNEENPNHKIQEAEGNIIQLTLMSFGRKYSDQPIETVENFNLEKLPNPAYNLRKQCTGLNEDLQQNFWQNEAAQKKYQEYKLSITNHLAKIASEIFLNCATDSGKENDNSEHKITFGFGCHSGKHRSVAIVNRLTTENWNFKIPESDIEITVLPNEIHRDIKRGKVKQEKAQQRLQKKKETEQYWRNKYPKK